MQTFLETTREKDGLSALSTLSQDTVAWEISALGYKDGKSPDHNRFLDEVVYSKLNKEDREFLKALNKSLFKHYLAAFENLDLEKLDKKQKEEYVWRKAFWEHDMREVVSYFRQDDRKSCVRVIILARQNFPQ